MPVQVSSQAAWEAWAWPHRQHDEQCHQHTGSSLSGSRAQAEGPPPIRHLEFASAAAMIAAHACSGMKLSMLSNATAGAGRSQATVMLSSCSECETKFERNATRNAWATGASPAHAWQAPKRHPGVMSGITKGGVLLSQPRHYTVPKQPSHSRSV